MASLQSPEFCFISCVERGEPNADAPRLVSVSVSVQCQCLQCNSFAVIIEVCMICIVWVWFMLETSRDTQNQINGFDIRALNAVYEVPSHGKPIDTNELSNCPVI